MAGIDVGPVDLVCGGFPCQPWSVAGQQRGAEDDRDLWPQMLRIVAAHRPRWIIGENVRGFVNEPMGLDRSLFDLEDLDYAVQSFLIPACSKNAPHRRDRIWIVAHSESERTQTGLGRIQETHGKIRQRNYGSEPGDTSGDVDNAQRQRGQSRTVYDGDELSSCSNWESDSSGTTGEGSTIMADAGRNAERSNAQLHGNKAKRGKGKLQSGDGDEDVADSEGKRLEGCEDDRGVGGGGPHSNKQLRGCGEGDGSLWLPEPNVGRVAHGVPNRVDRLKCLGNAVVPQVVEEIGKAILEADGHRSELRVLDLFSGIGGFSLGLERAGPFRTVGFCERDAFCRAVLRKHWPDTPIYDDIRNL